MKFVQVLTVVGIKGNKGTLDNGAAYDSTKLIVLTDLDETKGNQVGRETTAYTFGTSEEFQKLKHLPLPFDVEAEIQLITSTGSTGQVTRAKILSIKPVHKKAA